MSNLRPIPVARMLTRRNMFGLAVGAGLVGTGIAGVNLLRHFFEPALKFEPIAGLDGFRQMSGGSVSSSTAMALVGLEQTTKTPAETAADLCRNLFMNYNDPARVQMAYFSDSRCIYCRLLSPILHKLEAEGQVQIAWHDLPLLGKISTQSARAALAARRQGAYAKFHDRLMGTPFTPNSAYLSQLAVDAGINPEQLLQDMKLSVIDRQLAISAGLARRFGFYGTPAVVVGRTAVLGSINKHLLDRLIATEQAELQPGPC